MSIRPAFGLLLALVLSACGRDAAEPVTQAAPAVKPAEFVFTAIPDQDERQLRERFGIVADVLSESLGVPVRYVPVKSYAAAVSAFVNDEVQLAWFGGLSGVQARLRVPGARAIAQGVEDPNYHSLLIAHHGAGIEAFEQLHDGLRGKTLSFGDKGSTSGRLMPQFFLGEHFNEEPENIFSRVGFSGDHSRTVQLVQSGAYELGFIGYTVWDSELKRGTLDTEKVKIVWRSPGYPDYQWTIRGDVDARFGAGFSDRVQQTLLDIKDPDLLARFGRSGFIPATNDDFAPVADTARAVGLIE